MVQVGGTRRPYLDIDTYDGSTVVALAVVCRATGVTTVATVSGPVVVDGKGRWTAVAPYTLTSPGEWYERWTVTNAVSGLGAGFESTTINVDPAPPAATPPAWATVAQYANLIGGTMPDNLPHKLWMATLDLQDFVALGVYDPTAQATLDAKVQACCLQVKYAIDNGWTSGSGRGLTFAGQIGSVRVEAGKRADGAAGGVPVVDPHAAQVLASAGLSFEIVGTAPTWPVGWWS